MIGGQLGFRQTRRLASVSVAFRWQRRSRLLGVQRLQRRNFDRLLDQSANAARGGVGRGKRGDAGNVVPNGGPADRFFIVEGFAAERRVQNHVHFARLHQVHDVGPAFVYLVDGLGGNAGGFKSGGGAARGDQAEA